MWKTIIVNKGEKLAIRNNWLVVYCNELEQKIPVADIYALVLDNAAASVSVSVLSTLTLAGAHIYYCDSNHLPVSVSYPLNTYYKPLSVISKQINMTEILKDKLWQKIVKQKIENQALCLKYRKIDSEKFDTLLSISKCVKDGDANNREAVAAKKYFSYLFGTVFKRSDENDITNSALNYGYSIMRSSVGKSLAAHGYNGILGIHHKNESNPFNLADDLMEPLRPVVDMWVDTNCEELFETLTKSNRRDLISLVNMPINFGNKKMRIRYAIDMYIKSLTSAINGENADLFTIPKLLPLDDFYEDDLDG